jgi:hypothetical protein
MKLLGFLIVILIAGILFGFGSMIRFFKAIFGFGSNPSHTQGPKVNDRITRNKEDLSHKKPKIFKDGEGEYAEFEEVE